MSRLRFQALPPPVLTAVVCGWSAIIGACSDIPQSCVQMCDAAQVAQADCLAEDGYDWDETADRGWGSSQAFVHSCETWAWEARQLQIDAWWRGERGDEDIDETCAERDRALREAPRCATLENGGWQMPWEAPDDGT